jgi:tRNA (guanine26-N2/guanine27-N2)-dimethyltransferase
VEFQIAGPMWSAPIHDAEFLAKVLAHVDANKGLYGTAARMKGMLTLAKEAGFFLLFA